MAAKKSYFEKLKDPRWQKKRLEILNAADWRCELCHAEDQTLHVHHKTYLKGREPWEYERDQLVALCEECHESTHESDIIMDAVSRLPLDGPCNRDLMGQFLQGVMWAERTFAYPSDAVAYLMGKKFDEEYYRLLRELRNPESETSKAVRLLMGEN
jgi:hypothetical protein